jgi:hypothetical protein
LSIRRGRGRAKKPDRRQLAFLLARALRAATLPRSKERDELAPPHVAFRKAQDRANLT